MLADGAGFGFHKNFMFQAQVARGRREDCLAADKDFFAARHCAAHIVLADEALNFNRRFRGRLRLFPGIGSGSEQNRRFRIRQIKPLTSRSRIQ